MHTISHIFIATIICLTFSSCGGSNDTLETSGTFSQIQAGTYSPPFVTVTSSSSLIGSNDDCSDVIQAFDGNIGIASRLIFNIKDGGLVLAKKLIGCIGVGAVVSDSDITASISPEYFGKFILESKNYGTMYCDATSETIHSVLSSSNLSTRAAVDFKCYNGDPLPLSDRLSGKATPKIRCSVVYEGIASLQEPTLISWDYEHLSYPSGVVPAERCLSPQ